jgi:predicted acetyltransferase
LLIDVENQIVQFYALTSDKKGCGRQIVAAIVGATPDDWFLAVLMDWSGGFWRKMAEEYPRLALG